MAKKKKFPVFAILLVIGIALVGYGLFQADFDLSAITGLIGFSLVTSDSNTLIGCLPTDPLTCIWGFDTNAGLVVNSIGVAPENFFDETRVFPIENADTTKQMTLKYGQGTGSRLTGCSVKLPIHTITQNGQEIFLGSGSGTGSAGIDLQPLLVSSDSDLLYNIKAGGDGCSSVSVVGGLTGARTISVDPFGFFGTRANFFPPAIHFSLNPDSLPQINENSTVLLDTSMIADQPITVTGISRFAVAQSFQLENPTVITELEMQMSSLDPASTVQAMIWDLDQSPPLRIAVSEAFTGSEVGTVFGTVAFTITQAVVLLPTQDVVCITTPCNPVSKNYGVGIRVDGIDQGFMYKKLQFNQLPDISNFGVIDNAVSIQRETQFIDDNSMLSLKIRHDSAKAQELINIVEEIICQPNETLVGNECIILIGEDQDPNLDPVVLPDIPPEDEDIIACIAIFPPVPECTPKDANGNLICPEGTTLNIDPLTAQSCQFIIPEADCSGCNAPPPKVLQIEPRIPTEIFLFSGLVIIGIAVVGMIIRRRK